jgi:hypothetical protein
MRRFAVAVLALSIAIAVPAAQGENPPAPQQGPSSSDPIKSKPTLVHVVVHRPARHRVIVHRFTPPAHPSASYVFGVIAPAEAARFGASLRVLSCRIRRESGGHWWAVNGQHQGVGQFAYSTLMRGLRTMPHGVKLRLRRTVMRRTKVARIYSDGHVVRHTGRRIAQRQLVIMRGHLPRWPVQTHSWAQVRIMAQALRGISAVHSSEWSTRAACG